MAKLTPAYNITKAALNMLTVQYARSLGDEGFTVFCVSPGVCISILFPSSYSINWTQD